MTKPPPEELDTIVRHIKMGRRGGWRAKLDPVEWWFWFQGKRMDRFFGDAHGPRERPRRSPEESARIGTEMMIKGKRSRKDP